MARTVIGSRARLVCAGVLLVGVVLFAGVFAAVGETTATARWGGWASVVLAGAAAASLFCAAHLRGFNRGGSATYTGLSLLGWAALSWGIAGALSATSSLRAIGLSPVLGDPFAITALLLFALGFARFAPLPKGARPVLRHATDSYISTAAIFFVVWLVLFAPVYATPEIGSEPMGIAMVPVVADIAVLSFLAPLVITSPHSTRRAAAIAMAALASICAADFLGALTRLTGGPALGGAEFALRGVGLVLLVGLPWLLRNRVGAAPRRITGRGLYRFAPDVCAAAALAAATAAGVVAALRFDGGPLAPVLPVLAGTAVLALLLRVLNLLEENAALSRVAADRERHVHALARHNGDAVVVLDSDGSVHHASSGTAEAYGYTAEEIRGAAVSSLVHPEDQPRLRSAVVAFRKTPEADVRLRVRVRAADGTWRHTESTASRYEQPGAPQRLLVTARDISAQVALQEQVNHLTFQDGTTGLPNRAYLEERTRELLLRPRSKDSGAAVIFLDLDGFTAVNDSAGHAFGDYLLAQAARRLRSVVSPSDTVVRWGGDEFAVLVEHCDGAQQVVEFANRIQRAVGGEPFGVGDREVVLSASLGVAFADAETDSAELLRNADMAMARAKERGAGGRVEVYAPEMHTAVVRRLELQSQLRQALADEEFALEYQPVVELESSRITGVEALVRWRRGDTLRPPEEFLGAAEDSGLIVGLGEWILRSSCAAVARWRRAEWHVGLSVNLSVKQLQQPGFVDMVCSALSESDLPGDALTVEVGEEVLLEDSGEAAVRLGELRAMGVRLAIDDFGTGYASLAQLRPLRVDVLKIDPSFVAGLGTDSTVALLTSTIIGLGRDLGMQVIAEGIERPAQLNQLRAMGCGYGQGYLVGRPASADALTAVHGLGATL